MLIERSRYAIGIAGNTLVVGAYYDDDNGPNSGSIYLYDLVNSNAETKITPADTAYSYGWGLDVALSGNTLAVGAYRDDVNGIDSGSVHLYDLANSNAETKITASDGEASDNFGNRLALSGNKLAVGVDRDNSLGSYSGSVYLYDLANSNAETRITASNGKADLYFGGSVALSEDFLVVGEIGDDTLTGKTVQFTSMIYQKLISHIPMPKHRYWPMMPNVMLSLARK